MADRSIWAPWRSDFILGEKEPGCIFCRLARQKRRSFKNLILYRSEKSYVVMNKFPYNVGHLLIVPHRHVGLLEKLSEAEALDLMRLCQQAVAVLKTSLRPGAFNLGMNLGRPAGAGIPRHVHMHVVPRWPGDSNFMPVVGQTRVHSIPMRLIYNKLIEGFARL